MPNVLMTFWDRGRKPGEEHEVSYAEARRLVRDRLARVVEQETSDAGQGSDDGTERPAQEDWTKAQWVKWLVTVKGLDRDELSKMTKADIVEAFGDEPDRLS